MNLSGSIGFSLLSNKNKNILVFADAHSDVKYCENNFIKISEFFKNLLNNENYQILIEEVNRSQVKLLELWPNSEHIQNLKNLYLNNKNKVIPIDIRPYFYNFYWEMIVEDEYKDYGNILFKDYLSDLNFFFTRSKKISKEKSYLIFNEKIEDIIIDENYKEIIKNHYQKIKNSYLFYIKLCEKFLNNKLIDILNNNKNLLHLLDNLLSSIMEWYCIVLMLSTNKISIIHIGLFHSRDIVNNLVNMYGFKINEENGITKNPKDTLLSCVLLSKKMLKQIKIN
jgi:hypothetical protein